jgi:hypothetical protein
MIHPHVNDSRFRHKPLFQGGSTQDIPTIPHKKSTGKRFDRAASWIDGKSVAIIGSAMGWALHGPDLGSEVDAHDTVIRFHCEIPDPPLEVKFGKPKSTSVLVGNSMRHPELWRLAGSPDLWATNWDPTIKNQLEQLSLYDEVENSWFIHPSWNWNREVGLVTSGLMACELAIRGMGVEAYPSMVSIYGFDFYKTGTWNWESVDDLENYWPQFSVKRGKNHMPTTWNVIRKHEFDRDWDLMLAEAICNEMGPGSCSHFSGEVQRGYLEHLGCKVDGDGVWHWEVK